MARAEDFYDVVKGRKDPELCVVRHCTRRRNNGRLCSCHYQRMWRALNPLKAGYASLRDHAVERGISFTLTYEEFERHAIQTSYIEGKGRFAYCLSFDRKNPARGYHDWNVEVVTKSENSARRAREKHYPEEMKAHMARREGRKAGEEVEPVLDPDNAPF